MCGVAGFVLSEGTQQGPSLDGFLRALAHRGPDGEGRYEKQAVGLAQARLAIIDLKTGDQPLYGPGNCVLAANGEIYNYIELKAGLVGAQFSTQSDCEVPLHLFAKDGPDYARRLRGMYAIALWDGREKMLHLSRDPFGIKPLYYTEGGDGFAFASEPQALRKARKTEGGIWTQAAQELLQLQFIPGRETIFKGIQRVLPGETISITGGKIVLRRRLPALPDEVPLACNEDVALKELDSVLMDSVNVHQRSDVPYGMFLSGGVDSSALLACMARLNAQPVKAYTAGFPGTYVHDERERAKRVAKAVGAEHIEIEVREADFWKYLPAVAARLDDPSSDAAALPTYLLAAEAAKDVKVVLCGEGGDELFAGYGRYRSVLRPVWLGGKAMRRRGFLDGLGILRDSSSRWRDGYASAERRAAGLKGTRLQQAQALDCADWLPEDLLLKVDRCLMAHGVEGRTPFLDPVVADFAYRLPDKLKISGGSGKYLLRRWLEKALPEAEPFSRKRGFSVPAAEWIAPKAARLAPFIAKCSGIADICHPEKVAALFKSFGERGAKREGQACWQLLFYALWYRIHAEGCAAGGDIFSVLEAP